MKKERRRIWELSTVGLMKESITSPSTEDGVNDVSLNEILQQWSRSPFPLAKSRKEVIYNGVTREDPICGSPIEDYTESLWWKCLNVSKKDLERALTATKDLLEKRALRLDPTASHLGRVIVNTGRRRALQ
ncbi:unnamed protein product [Strongylus vulgaris]|uniref:Uncharacterized protein n=1 Tax=Strongylus vulgaris TaxID=40348 RepID=A0A3P7HZI1_STRVU|nr:unnamed protein product [Strongylus vulgaris]